MPSENEQVELQQTIYTSSNPTRRWLHCTRRDWIINAIHTVGNQRQRALEVGPGSGIYVPVLAQLYDEVVALDIEQAYLNHVNHLTRTTKNLAIKIDDITCSSLPSASFDLILCTEVVEHLPDSSSALREMRRLLRPNGVLILSTPQRYSPLEVTAKIAFLPGIINLVRLIYQEPILETGHINLMTAHQMVQQLKHAGFHIQQSYKSGLYIPLVAEFFGASGLKAEQWIESKLRGSPFDGLLWTQYYVARPDFCPRTE